MRDKTSREKVEKAAPPATVRDGRLRRTSIDAGSQTATDFPAGHPQGMLLFGEVAFLKLLPGDLLQTQPSPGITLCFSR